MNAAPDLRAWIGRTETLRDTIDPTPVAALAATLDHPAVDFVSLARGYGVPGVRVESAAELSSALARSFATEGPMLIDACW